MSVGALIFEIIANTGRFETDTGRAAKIAEKRAKEIERSFSQIGAKIGRALALVGGPAGLGLMIKNSIDAAAELDDLSQKTGVAVEQLSRLQYAAGLEGVEDLGSALDKLAKNIGSNADFFADLGISVKDARGELKTTDEVLLDLADLFQKSADGTRKQQIAIEALGKSGAQLIPFLNRGRDGIKELSDEADRLGVTISGSTSKAADDFNNNMYRLKEGVKGAVNEITQGLLPSLNRITEAMLKSADGASVFEKVGKGLGVVFETITVLGANVAYVIEQIGITLGGLYAIQTKVFTGDFKGAVSIWNEMGADAEAARKEIDAFSESVLNAKKAAEAPAGTEGPKAQLPDVEAIKKAREEAARAAKKAADDAQREAEKALKDALDAEERQRQSINAVIEALQDESANLEATNAQIQERTLRKLGATEAEIAEARALANSTDARKKLIELDEERAQVLKDTRTYAEVYADEVARLNVLFENGTRDAAIYNRAVAAAQDAFDKAEKAAEEAAGGMAVFADQAARNMQDAFADFLFNPFENGVKGMVRSFAQALQRMAAEALAANIFGAITSGAGGSGGGNLFGSLFSLGASFFSGGMSSSGTYSAANIAPRALGGPVMAGTPYLVGERGPELMVPSTSGKIVPNNALGKSQVNLRNINLFDTQVIADYLSSSAGEQVVLNTLSRNGTRVRTAIGG